MSESDSEQLRLTDLIFESEKLSTSNIQALERRLRKDSSDMRSRMLLLCHYGHQQYRNKRFAKKHNKHALWVIANLRLDPIIAHNPYICINPHFDPGNFRQGRDLWLKHIEDNPTNVALLHHASDYLFIYDKETAEALLLKAKALEPLNAYWLERLAFLHYLGSKHGKVGENPIGDTSQQHAKEALHLQEEAYSLVRNESEKFDYLYDLPKLACRAGDIEKGLDYAIQVLLELFECSNFKDVVLCLECWSGTGGVVEKTFNTARLRLESGSMSVDQRLALLLLSQSNDLGWWGGRARLCSDLVGHITQLRAAAKAETEGDIGGAIGAIDSMALAGCSLAKYLLANIYERIGTDQSLKNAVTLYSAASEHGIAAASNHMIELQRIGKISTDDAACALGRYSLRE